MNEPCECPIEWYNFARGHCSACGTPLESLLMQSCCGGAGNIRWSDSKKQWSCTDCGSVKSNDPNYYWTPKASNPSSPQWPSESPKCECGAAKAKTTHAFWCGVKN